MGVALVGGVVLPTGRAALGSGAGPSAGTSGLVERHVVQPGETLWEIARQAVGAEGDPRPLVERIRRANRLAPTDVLLPGVPLMIPPA